MLYCEYIAALSNVSTSTVIPLSFRYWMVVISDGMMLTFTSLGNVYLFIYSAEMRESNEKSCMCVALLLLAPGSGAIVAVIM